MPETETKIEKQTHPLSCKTCIFLALCVPAYALYIWFTYQSQYFSFGNNSWLMIAAERMLNGQSMLQHYYETNPPLSVILYIPHVLASWAFNIPAPVAGFYVTTLQIFISLGLTSGILKKFIFLSETQKLLFLFSLFLAMTMAPGIFITEREHLIFIWLAPFILNIFAISEKIKLPATITLPILIMGSIMVLVKPHYGIIPATMFVLRTIQQRKTIGLIKDLDFQILTLATFIYLTLLVIFSDYSTIILPDVIALYAKPESFHFALNIVKNSIVICIALITIEFILNDIKSTQKRFINLIHICLCLSFIPYFVQMKGLPNHIIPINAFFILAMSTSLILRIEKTPKKFARITPFLGASIILALSINHTPISTKTLQHKDAEKLEVMNYIQDNCTKPCTYFAFHSDIEVFNPISAYSGMTHGTRYSVFWWIKQLYSEMLTATPKQMEKIQSIKKRHETYVAEDLLYYNPKLILLAKDLPMNTAPPLNFLEFFGKETDVNKIFEEKYEKVDEISFTYKDYYKGTNFKAPKGGYRYDVYKRIKMKNE